MNNTLRIKRKIDIVIVIIAIIFFILPFFFLILFLRYKVGSPVLFRQIRAGLNGKPFELIKFRTMTNARSPDGKLLNDAERLTKFGKFMRGTSLDELPNIWNVLKGEMSLVGPRPLLIEYLSQYTTEQCRRNEILPGITGWAQINGRNCISWDDKFKLDVWYVDNQSIWLDIKIMLLTVIKVVKRDGINPYDEEFMPEFRKNKV
jgi:lipopolysaccharide/colanic/teichoic acid biosynthesis glycosyltransferase